MMSPGPPGAQAIAGRRGGGGGGNLRRRRRNRSSILAATQLLQATDWNTRDG